MAMLSNYLKISVRNLLKHKVFSFINIFGLAIGITCCVLLGLYVKDELEYEKHFEGADRVYRITSTFVQKDIREEIIQRTSPPVAMTMLEELTDLESATRVVSPPEVEQHLIRYHEKGFYEKKGYLVDSTFFDVFPYEFAEGDRATALRSPSSVVLTYEVAQKFFGNTKALDELIIIQSGQSVDTFRVTGVLKPIDKKSHVDANFYMTMNSRGWGQWINSMTSWDTQNFIFSYLKLKSGVSPDKVIAKFPALMEKYGAKESKEMGRKKIHGLQSLLDIHLYSTHFAYNFDMGSPGNINYLYILGSIGFFILLLACINFINLTTAQASQRAGEVGIRKAIGASRSLLIRQFLGESISLSFMAMILSFGIIQVALPLFNDLAKKDLELNSGNLLYTIAVLSLVTLISGLAAGAYPAFFLSSFQPAKAIKDKRLSMGSSNVLRKGLIVFQFVVAITLISSLLIIQKQLKYIQGKSLGFDTDYKLLVPLRSADAAQNYNRFKLLLSNIPGVNQVSAASGAPSTPIMRDFSLYLPGETMENAVHHFNISVDENYFKQLNIPIIAGRDFIFESDSSNWGDLHRKVIINRQSMKELNLTLENSIGAEILTNWQSQTLHHEIIGVVEDFHQFSLHEPMKPLLFIIPAQTTDYVFSLISVSPAQAEGAISAISSTWKQVDPTTPFESEFLNESVKKQYEDDKRVAKIFTIFTVIAIAISCLGLYGLSVFMAERRIKEIGIRKVLGASVNGIITMLSKDFILLVLLAFALAVPISYYAMSQWLENFAFRTELGFTVFILSGIIAVTIAWLTVGFESFRAARGNPVDSLRNE